MARDTSVTAKGATHKTLELKAEGKGTKLTDFVKNGDQVTVPGIVATKYNDSGLPPSIGLDQILGFSGFLAGIQGPIIPEIEKLGLKIPADRKSVV